MNDFDNFDRWFLIITIIVMILFLTVVIWWFGYSLDGLLGAYKEIE